MKAVAVVRQSSGRGKAEGASLADQEALIRERCKREGWKLVAVYEEQDVSGGRALAKRPGMLQAVEAVEAGRADVVVVAYFDRLVRSLAVQAEIVQRVEAAGAGVLTLDAGEVKDSTGTASEWLSGQVLGMMSEYTRRRAVEHAKAVSARKREAGEWRGGKLPFYRRVEDKRVEYVEDMLPVVVEAFTRRADGASHEAVRTYLREATGLPFKSLIIVSRMLQDETLVSDGVVPGALFRRVSNLHAKRGPRPASERLLARLDVLHCHCGGRMVVHGSKSQVQVYRCGSQSCDSKASITCEIAEDVLATATREALHAREGRAGSDLEALAAERDRRAALLDAAIDTFSALANSERAKSKLADLEAGLATAEDALADARDAAGLSLDGALAWEFMSREQRRSMIRAAIKTASVARGGTGAGRISLKLSAAFAPEALLDAVATKTDATIERPSVLLGDDPDFVVDALKREIRAA